MSDKDAATTQPDGGQTGVEQSIHAHEVQVIAHAVQRHNPEGCIPRHILLVEDDASLAKVEADVLQAHGYAVVIAENGEIALRFLREVIPDLVLLDLSLPGTITGWDILRELRATDHTTTLPVLLTSSEVAVHRRMRTRGEGRSTLDHLPKPYPMQTLLKRIARMLAIEPSGY